MTSEASLDRRDPDEAIDRTLMVAMRQAGFVARGLRGKVRDEGKPESTVMPHDHDALRARRAAKTVVDEIVQDVLLVAVAELWGPYLALDAEEDTVMRRSFIGDGTLGTLVVDPVDGTIDYLDGRDSYSICLGVVRCGSLTPAYVYFAGRDRAYYVSTEGVPYRVDHVSSDGMRHRTRLESQVRATDVVYVNGRVPGDLQATLLAAGYDVRDDTENDKGAADCLVACIEGEAICYLSHTRHVRDVMLGAVIGAMDGGFARDWTGAPLTWPDGGRIARAVFGVGSLPPDVGGALALFG